jgi:hypothetical protein
LARLADAPMTVGERLLIAERRLGAPETLVEEFAKGDPGRLGRDRLFWGLLGCLGLSLARELLEQAARVILIVVWRIGGSLEAAGLSAFLCQVLGWSCVVWFLVKVARGQGVAFSTRLLRVASWPLGTRVLVGLALAMAWCGAPSLVVSSFIYPTMRVADVGFQLHALALGNLALNVGLVASLMVALAVLAGRRAPGRENPEPRRS